MDVTLGYKERKEEGLKTDIKGGITDGIQI